MSITYCELNEEHISDIVLYVKEHQFDGNHYVQYKQIISLSTLRYMLFNDSVYIYAAVLDNDIKFLAILTYSINRTWSTAMDIQFISLDEQFIRQLISNLTKSDYNKHLFYTTKLKAFLVKEQLYLEGKFKSLGFVNELILTSEEFNKSIHHYAHFL